MDRILTACARETLAETALYSYSRGGQEVTGPSIRMAEELARSWGNVLCGVTELSRLEGRSECMAYCWDLETNFRDEKRFTVRHWRDTKKGGYAVTEERDIYELVANMGARRKRACILAVIPGDVTEAATKQCEVTMATKEAVTPERLKGVLEAFGRYGITKEHIEKRVQRHLDSITPAQLVQLRKIFNSLKDGMSQPGDWFEVQAAEAAPAAASATEAVKQKLAARHGKRAETPPPADEHVPIFSKETALEALHGAATVALLDKAFADIKADFAASRRELPVDVEAAHTELREGLLKREAMQKE